MDFLLRFVGRSLFLKIMAVTAALLFVAINTPKAKQFDMIFMVKCNNRALFVRRIIDFYPWNGDSRMWTADDIGLIRFGFAKVRSFNRQVADSALRVMAPFSVT